MIYSIMEISKIESRAFENNLTQQKIDRLCPPHDKLWPVLFILGLCSGLVAIICAVYHHFWWLTGLVGWLGVYGIIKHDIKRSDGPFGFLSKKVYKRIEAFNDGLAARQTIEDLVLSAKEPDLYKAEMYQWEARRRAITKEIEFELDFWEKKAWGILVSKQLKNNKKQLKNIEKALKVLEGGNPNARHTSDYASLITAAMAKQQLEE